MALLGPLAAIASIASAGVGVASAFRKPPKPAAIPAPGLGDPNEAGRIALGRERLRRGRRSTILTGASALLDAEELAAGGEKLLGE